MITVVEQLKKINFGKYGDNVRPHKFALMLAIAKLYEKDPFRENKFCITDSLENLYKDCFQELSPNYNKSLATIDHPFYYLKNDGFWFLIIKHGLEGLYNQIQNSSNIRFTKKRLIEIVSYACLSDQFDEFLRDECNRTVFCMELKKHFLKGSHAMGNEEIDFERIIIKNEHEANSNPFVDYLNSLQRLNACNENALAESQACDPQFTHIHVSHPLTQTIVNELKNINGRHVILTGHAGDGKSTIAVEVYKHLKRVPVDQHLHKRLDPREDIDGTAITIIKDLSERHKNEDSSLVNEFNDGLRRFLLVTNTGTLLDLFRQQSNLFGLGEDNLESDVLTSISSEQGEGELILGNTQFKVFNLARIDNLHIAREIFEKMLSPDRWNECSERDCRYSCPIYLNVDLIQSNKHRIFDRIFLAYRRMYEYGCRLTMRQLTEHLAYLVTSGLGKADVAEMQQKNHKPLKVEYMFFNRFFGDNGRVNHSAAQQMKAIREIQKQGFGERPCPTWERQLWLRSHGTPFRLGVDACDSEFELLRNHGSRSGDDNHPGLTPDQAREQVRRMLYFLYDFSEKEQSYLCQYLNSPTVLRWMVWQTPDVQLDNNEKYNLENSIYHVLQEHFTGVRLPEGTSQKKQHLFVTLSRRRSEVRQSAQVVLAMVDWNSTVLHLRSVDSVTGVTRTDLFLEGRDRINGISLKLMLPFLDYVVLRHFGELGEVLQTAYLERIERFKAQVQKLAGAPDDRAMLVRLKTDNTFRRQYYSVKNGKLEVNDAH